MCEKNLILSSLEATDRFAAVLAANLKKGDVLALYGELGAGKTTFAICLCSHLGVTETVNSPSYVLLNQYRGVFPISHLDLYRLADAEEVYELGIHELFESSLTIIEWPEIAEELLPARTIKLFFSYEDADGRTVKIRALPEIIARLSAFQL